MERLALEEARAMVPSPELRDEVWKGLEAAILPAAATAAAVGALSEGASAGSRAAATTVAGGKAAVGAATHVGFAVLPALKVVAAAAIVLGSTAGVGFAVGRGWSALTQRDAPEQASVAEVPRPAAPSAVPGSSTPARFAPASPALEPLRMENAGNAGDLRAAALPAASSGAPANPRADASESSRTREPASASSSGAHSTASAAVRPTGFGAPAPASPVSARVVVAGAPSAGPLPTAAATGSARPSTGGAIYGADEESLLASEAREALRAGDPRRSLALLQRMQGLGGAGVLDEERGLLEIEALLRLGDRDGARERARAFLRTWPESVYGGRVQAMLRGL
jgi:hypothetical protein